MGGNLRTHEDKYSICIAFPIFHHLLVLFNSSIKIHREQSFRTLGRLGVTSWGLILLGRYNIWRGCSKCEDERWLSLNWDLMTVPYLDHAQPGLCQGQYSPRIEALTEMGTDIRREKGAVQRNLFPKTRFSCLALVSARPLFFLLRAYAPTYPRYRTNSILNLALSLTQKVLTNFTLPPSCRARP
jgi:hypothetical protein